MKCPKCGYVSHDYLDACRKCSVDLVEFKKSLHLDVIRPGDLDLSVVLVEQDEKMERTSAYNIDDEFFSAQTMLVEREEVAEQEDEEFDISLDDDLPETAARASTLDDASMDMDDNDDFVSLEESEEEEAPLQPVSTESSSPPASSMAPVDMIDMSDLEDLDEIRIDLDETSSHTTPIASEEDTVTLDDAAIPRADSLSDSESTDITFELTDFEENDAPPPAAALEPRADPSADNLLEADLELELEEDTPKPAEPETDLLIDFEELDLRDDEEEDRPKPS
jgi:hypothetical protein